MCAKLNQVFDASKVDPAKAFDPLPSGWYPAVISESEIKPGAKTGCSQLRFTYTVASGPLKGRKVWDGINWTHTKPETAAMGQQQFSAICHAVAVIKVPDTKVLHDKVMEIKVEQQEARWVGKDGKEVEVAEGAKPPLGARFYDAGNRVRGWRALDKKAAAAAPAVAAEPPADQLADEAPAAEKPEASAAPETQPEESAEDTREFYAYLDGENKEMTGKEIADALRDGMPEDTPVVIQGESDWKTAAAYEIEATPAEEQEAPPPLPAPPAKKTPPAPAAKVTAPAAKAEAAPATGAKKSPPWLKKK